jgi:hypothetical protein
MFFAKDGKPTFKNVEWIKEMIYRDKLLKIEFAAGSKSKKKEFIA